MNNYQFYYVLAFVIFAQTTFSQKYENRCIVDWNEPIKECIAENDCKSFLSFSGCVYKDGIPYYTFGKVLGNSKFEYSILAKLKNVVYEDVSESEKNIINSFSDYINSENQINVEINTSRKISNADIFIMPIKKGSSGSYKKLTSFIIEIDIKRKEIDLMKTGEEYASNSVLSSGKWYEIAISEDGIYKLTYSNMESLGMDMGNINPDNIRLYGNGGGMLPHANSEFRYDDLQENPIEVVNATNGVFKENDYIIFYGKGPTQWQYNSSNNRYWHTQHLYSNYSYYFINTDLGSGKRIQKIASLNNPDTTISTFDDYAFYENDSINLLRSGRKWLGEEFDILTTYNFNEFTFSNLYYGADIKLIVSLSAQSTSESSFDVEVTGHSTNSTITISNISGGPYDAQAVQSTKSIEFSPKSNTFPVSITYNKPTSSSVGWLDYMYINVTRELKLTDGQMLFRDMGTVDGGKVTEFELSNAPSMIRVLDATNPVNLFEVSGNLNSSIFTFSVQTDSLREFAAFDGTSYLTPTLIGNVSNQNLHHIGLNSGGDPEPIDMIIVSHPDFLSEAEQLAKIHEEEDSMIVNVVTTVQVFNEFSSGSQDVCAIRDFMRMFYKRTDDDANIPRYLLLYGDGSYDPKNRLSDNTNFVITFQNSNAYVPTQSYVSDDFFALLDDNEGEWDYGDNGKLDIGVGRIPVKTREESITALNKIKSYMDNKTMREWRNIICFVADDEDNNLHQSQSDQLATYVDTTYKSMNIDKIYIDAYEQESSAGGQSYPDANLAITNRVNKGALIVNYTGHGGENGWAHERILEITDINNWDNIDNMPVLVTATCEFSRFDDPAFTSAGEHAFLSPNGAAIALLTTVRVVYAAENKALNMDFYETVFDKENGDFLRIGDIFMKTKNLGGVVDNDKNFTLLGDPALRIAYPVYYVATDSINGQDINEGVDTLKALSKVTISGFVFDEDSNIIDTYNGTLYPVVYDKFKTIETLANDEGSSKASFNIQNNILFKGKASITNGKFKFSFIMPKDIAYQNGNGKLSFYAENGNIDANGYFEDFIIGGTDDSAASDNKGPEVELYMNDEDFVYGGLTDENPILLANIFDSNGVNTVGNGIGHDIMAILDEKTDDAIVLNEYYEADLNSYQSGKISYPYYDLSDGRHTLQLSVWDVYNNSSDIYTEFVVAESAELALSHVLNYPNPFTTNTAFYFEHNQPGVQIEVMIQVFTVSGKLVKTLYTDMLTEGYRSEPMYWNGLDDYGDRIGKGAYIYKVTVSNQNSRVETYEKLVLLR